MTEPLAITQGGVKHLCTTMTFRDVDFPDRIDSLATVNTRLIQRLERQKQDHHTFDILGTIVLVPIGTGSHERFPLMVHDLRLVECPLQMICAMQAEIEEARRTLRGLHRQKKTIYDHILSTLAEGLGIKGLGKAPEPLDSLEAVTLQAFSDGWVNNAS